jgi:hypothetical protein
LTDNDTQFIEPRPLEYREHYRPGLGTENVGPFLRSMVQMLRPNRVLEIGAGYTTPFLLEALVNNERVFNDGNLKEEYLSNYNYDPKLVVIDDMSLGDLSKRVGMDNMLKSKYINFFEGLFQGKATQLHEQYGFFDFVWFDCGDHSVYEEFFSEYWDICSAYIICHFTYSDGKPNQKLTSILNGIKGSPFRIDIIEPHKTRQGSLTIIKKQLP